MDGPAKAWIDDGRIMVNSGWLTDNLPCTRETLSKWRKKGLPQIARGKYDLVSVLAWRGLIGPQNERGPALDAVALAQQKLEADVRWKKEQGELVAFKNEVNAGNYIRKSLLIDELSKFFLVFKKSALMIPRRVAGEINALVGSGESKRIEARALEIVTDALSQMAIDGVWKP